MEMVHKYSESHRIFSISDFMEAHLCKRHITSLSTHTKLNHNKMQFPSLSPCEIHNIRIPSCSELNAVSIFTNIWSLGRIYEDESTKDQQNPCWLYHDVDAKERKIVIAKVTSIICQLSIIVVQIRFFCYRYNICILHDTTLQAMSA